MKEFWKFLLRRSLPSNSLQSLNFAVIGLGDSSYSKFNFVAKRLHKRLTQLGGKSMLPVALCDDQHDLGIGAILFPFLENLWIKLLDLRPIPIGRIILAETPRFLRWNAVKCQKYESDDENQDIFSDFEETSTDGFAEVVENVRTTSADHFQDVRLLSFCRCNLTWKLGDVAYIRPKNSSENVCRLFEIFEKHNLGIRPDDLLTLQQIDDGESKSIFLFFYS